jgi:hypothetical protein
MIGVPFFFSHLALSIGVGRDGIGLKMMEIAQTDTHSAFNVLGFCLKASSFKKFGR